MRKNQKKKWWRLVLEFVKLQLAGNVLFWGTYLGYALGHEFLHWDSTLSMTIGSLSAHVLFFIIDKNWVFSTKTGKKKTQEEIIKFIIFMGLNFFINLGITLGLERYFGITPYIGQFIAGVFFAVWSYLGLKFWVFSSGQHAAHHHGLTVETSKSKENRHARAKRLAAKQKAKRTARLY